MFECEELSSGSLRLSSVGEGFWFSGWRYVDPSEEVFFESAVRRFLAVGAAGTSSFLSCSRYGKKVYIELRPSLFGSRLLSKFLIKYGAGSPTSLFS
jgi:hypothetical protein